MIGIVQGQLVTSKIKQPQAGQDFKPHQLLSVMQVFDGDAEIVKIKDLDLTRTYNPNFAVRLRCRINHWSNNNASGQAISVIEVLPVEDEIPLATSKGSGSSGKSAPKSAKAKEDVKL